MAWNYEKSLTCSTCGTRDEEWRDPSTGRRYDPPPYDVITRACAGCEDLEAFKENEDVQKHAHRGIYLSLAPHDTTLDEMEMAE